MKLSGIFQTAFFVALFLTFINGGIGWLMVYTFLAAILLSFLLWLLSHKHFTVETEEFSGITEVGADCTVQIKLRKNGFCFIPTLAVEGLIEGQRFVAYTSLLFRNESVVKVHFRPRSCGLNTIEIIRCTDEDIFGLFCGTNRTAGNGSVAVLPRRVEYVGPDVQPSLLPSENEEREEGTTVTFGGTAGYEHREYTPGDSPRRINYKLSAKKRRLLVRMDESNGTASVNILLSDDADSECLERALALADRLIMNGGSATVHHHGEQFSVTLPASVVKLREWLAFRDLDGASVAKSVPSGGRDCVIIAPLEHNI